MKDKQNYLIPGALTAIIAVIGYPMLLNENGAGKATLIALLGISFVWIFHFGVGQGIKSNVDARIKEEKEKESEDFI